MGFADTSLKILRSFANKSTFSQPLKVNSEGTALLSKMNLSKDVLENIFQGKELPTNVFSGNFVRVGRNNSFNDDFVNILTLKDKDGKIVARIKDDVSRSKNISKVSVYNRPALGKWNGDGDHIPGKIEETDIFTTIFTDNNKVKELFTQQQKQTTSSGEEFWTIGKVLRHNSKYNFTPETQSLYEFSKHTAPKGYKLAAIRDSEGGVRVIDVKSEGIKINQDNPYLGTYLYDRDDFVKANYRYFLMRNRIAEENIAPKLVKSSEKLTESGTRGLYSGVDETVHLNPLMRGRKEIVKNIAHELEHFIQYAETYRLDSKAVKATKNRIAYLKKNGKNMNFKEIEEAQKYLESIKNYVSVKENRGGYYANYIEEKARQAGKEALEEYNAYHDEVFGQLSHCDFNVTKFNA